MAGNGVEALEKSSVYHKLQERIKELNCLYGLSGLASRPDVSLEEILRGTVALIPPAWQYPEITCGRIVYGNRVFTTANFKVTDWKLSAPLRVHEQDAGSVEAYYLEKTPECGEGSFLKEERSLIRALAERLGRIIERKVAEEQLRMNNRALGERVKELNCLYQLSGLASSQKSLTEVFQGIADLIPRAWQYPDIACARVVYKQDEYRSRGFRVTRWKQSAPIRANGENTGCIDLYYLKERHIIDEGPFLIEERNLLNTISKHLGEIVEQKTGEEALKQKNAALKEILVQIEIEKKIIRDNVIANVDVLLLPTLKKMKMGGYKTELIDLLQHNLEELTFAFGRKISMEAARLSAREIEICNLVRNGLTSKEIANLLHLSSETVAKHRYRIRNKLGIANKKLNLTSYLQTL